MKNKKIRKNSKRESKHNTIAPLDGILTTSHLWTYYLLGGNKQQLAVYNGRETSETDACSNNSHRVHYYPMEYLTYGNGSSALMTTRPNGNQEYKVTDHLGSTRVVVDSTGYILSQYDYEPFGKPLAKTGLDSRKSYIDKEKDYESGLGNYGVRSYDDDLGRLTTTEPLWEKLRGWSLYQYSYNNPLRFQDGNGKLPGDLFTSPTQAAHDFGKNYTPVSFDLKVEVGSYIYEVVKDGQKLYSYTIPDLGDESTINPSAHESYPSVAWIHTHGQYKAGFDMNAFSDKVIDKKDGSINGDKTKSRDENIPGYLVGTNGNLLKFDPKKPEKTTVVSRDMPRDSNDPASKKNKTAPVKNNETRDVTYRNRNLLPGANIIYEKK
ncbi:MAG: DUF4329 domain-containing protein [Bacteroidetes bacterium]|nr:DUF4329 domain-containing protein [Bacteroidota bacterium]